MKLLAVFYAQGRNDLNGGDFVDISSSRSNILLHQQFTRERTASSIFHRSLGRDLGWNILLDCSSNVVCCDSEVNSLLLWYYIDMFGDVTTFTNTKPTPYSGDSAHRFNSIRYAKHIIRGKVMSLYQRVHNTVPRSDAQWSAVLPPHSSSLKLMSNLPCLTNILNSSNFRSSPIDAASCKSSSCVIRLECRRFDITKNYCN